MTAKNVSVRVLLSIALVFCSVLTLFAEEDWVESYTKELKESGYTSEEIKGIIEKERKRRANKSSDSERKQAVKELEDAVKESDNSSEEEKEKSPKELLEEQEKLWREILAEEHGLEKRDLEKVLRLEMDVQRKLVKLKEEDRIEKDDELHQEAAIKRLKSIKVTSTTKLGKKRASRYNEIMGEFWDEWFYLGQDDFEKEIEGIVDNYKKQEVANRVERAKKTRETVLKEINDHYDKESGVCERSSTIWCSSCQLY